MSNFKKIIGIVTVIIFIAGCGQIVTPTNPTENITKKISVFVDEEPLNPNNLKKIKIAIVNMSETGDLSVEVVQKDNQSIKTLQKAVSAINKRSTLRLTGENEIVVDGKKVLAMQAWEVKKGEENYIYAVLDALSMEFGLDAELENNR